MAARARNDFVAGQVLTAAQMDALPGGWVGYLVQSSSQGSITTETDITALSSLTVTLEANRLYKCWAELSVETSTATEIARARIYRGADVQVARKLLLADAADEYVFPLARVFTVSSGGSYTFKVTLERIGTTGTLQATASSNTPGILCVEDLGSV